MKLITVNYKYTRSPACSMKMLSVNFSRLKIGLFAFFLLKLETICISLLFGNTSSVQMYNAPKH